jgi:hypothetical protein
MGAGGARATVISGSSFATLSILRGVGKDIRRGLAEAACNFLDVSVKLRSSCERRGIRDRCVSGDELGDDGGDGS